MIRLLFYILMTIRNWLYDCGLFSCYKSKIPIISIGNITVGGTGKTPFVIYLIKKVLMKGLNPLIISRGYKRTSKGLVFFNGNFLKKSKVKADYVGDEPFLISKKFPNIDIIINKSRAKAVQYAECLDNKYDVIILDDAFQHRSLHRDLDIVLINTNQNHSGLLPRGLLREPFQNISRADCVVLTKNNPKFDASILDFFKNPIFKCQEKYSLSSNKNEGVGFCGVGNPTSFWKTLEGLSVRISKKIEFKDHQEYTCSEINSIESLLTNQTTFFTTEKDWVKLPEDFISKHDGVFVNMDVDIEDSSFDQIINKTCQLQQ